MQLGQLELFYYIHSQSEGSGIFGGVDKTAGLQSTFEWKDQCHLSVLQCGRCVHAIVGSLCAEVQNHEYTSASITHHGNHVFITTSCRIEQIDCLNSTLFD